jgi:PAP2 superfamily
LQTAPSYYKPLIVKIPLTAIVIACTGALALSRQFYTEALADAFFGLALGSIVILHLRICRKYLDLLLLAGGTILIGFVDFRILHYGPRIMAWFSFLGISSLLIMVVRTIWAPQRKMLLYTWVPSALFVASDYFASTMLAWTSAAHPKTFDAYLLSFDGSMRIQLSYAVGRLYALNSWLHSASLLAYIGLALPIAVVYSGRLLRFKEKAWPVMLAFLITGPLGIAFYNLFPACGPAHLIPGFPFREFPTADLPRLHLEAVAVVGPRNAIPSLHMAWTLLAWWYSRGLSWWERAIAFAFLALTVVATMGTGEHYFVDLVVAFPFALMIQALCAYPLKWKDVRRLTPFAFGLFLTLAWLMALRYSPRLFWTSAVVPWALVIATIALSSLRQVELDRAADAAGAVVAKGEPRRVPSLSTPNTSRAAS